MKVRQTLCAFTKFRHLLKTMSSELNVTTKGLKTIQGMVDTLVLQQVTLLYKNIPNRTIRGKHVTFLIRAFRNMGLSEANVSPTSRGYSPRLGYHVVKRVDPKFRIGKDAHEELFKLYAMCLGEILQTIQAEIVDPKKRVTPPMITKIMEHSRMGTLM